MASADRLVDDAERARAAGQAPAACLALLKALSIDPEHHRALFVLGTLVDATDAPDRLIDADAHSEAALALGAFCAERTAEPAAALSALLALLTHRPLSPFVVWAERVLRQHGERADPRQVVTFLGARLAEAPGVVVDDAPTRRALECLLSLAAEAARYLDDDAAWLVLSAALHRKTGRTARALRDAQRARAKDPGWKSAIAVAMAHRARGEIKEALEAYACATALDPDDLTALLDVADMLLENHRTGDAVDAYRVVLEREPDQAWASPSLLYAEAVVDPSSERVARLTRYAADNPENQRARTLSADLRARQTPYVGFLPLPRGPLVRLLAQAIPESGAIELQLPEIEAPSARLAARLQLQALGLAPRLDLSVARIPALDPRLPRRPVRYVLWQYEGITPRPCLPRPPPDVMLRIAELAAPARPLSTMWQRSREVALALQDRGEEVLATMTHPPPPLLGRPAWGWLQRLQVAAAFVIARLPGPWRATFREEALTSLAWGVPDWSVEAALCALARLAHAEPEASGDVRDLFRGLLSESSPASPRCFDYGLVCNALFLPNLTQAERRRLLARRQAIEQRS